MEYGVRSIYRYMQTKLDQATFNKDTMILIRAIILYGLVLLCVYSAIICLA